MSPKIKTAFLALLLSQSGVMLPNDIQAQTQTASTTTKHFVTVDQLKTHFSSRLNVPNFTSKSSKREVKTADGTALVLYPKMTNNSPFINADASKEENASRLYFEPTESKYKDIYLGAVFTEDKIKKNPNNIRQWNAFNGESIFLTGVVHSSNAQLSEQASKHKFLTSTVNHLTGAVMPRQADYTSISGVATSKSEARSMQVDVGGSYMTVSVDMGYSQSNASSSNAIKVVMVSKVYSLEVNKVHNIQATDKNYDITKAYSYLDPKLKPMYVSSIDYGFAIEAEIMSNDLSEDQRSKLAASIEYGLASGKAGFDYSSSLGSKEVSVKFTYHGVSPSVATASDNIQNIVALMQRESRNFMNNFSKSSVPAIPLSCKLRYLFPTDIHAVSDDVRINDILLANEYVAMSKPAPKKLAAPVKAKIVTMHMAGIKTGYIRDYGQSHVYLNTIADNTGASYSYWYFYIDKRKAENISKKEYYDKSGKDIFKIENPKIDQNGNFYVYVKLQDHDAKPDGTDIVFNKWQRSDQPINISEIKPNATKKVTFFDGDLTMDLTF